MIWPGRGAEGSGRAGTGCRMAGPGIGDDDATGGVATGAGAAGGCAGIGIGIGRGPLPSSGGRTGCATGRAAIFSSVVRPGGKAGATDGVACTGSAAGASASTGEPACSSTAASGSSASCSNACAAERSTETPKCRRILSATSSSIELECVFLSVTPNCGSTVMIALLGCSHSRASSLIRIFRITTLFSWTACFGRRTRPCQKLRNTVPEPAPIVL